MVPGLHGKTLHRLKITPYQFVGSYDGGREDWASYHRRFDKALSGDTRATLARKSFPDHAGDNLEFVRERRGCKDFLDQHFPPSLEALRTLMAMGFFSEHVQKVLNCDGKERTFNDFRTLDSFSYQHPLFPFLSFLIALAYWNGSQTKKRETRRNRTTIELSLVAHMPIAAPAFIFFLERLEQKGWLRREHKTGGRLRFVSSLFGRVARPFFHPVGRRTKDAFAYPQVILSALETVWASAVKNGDPNAPQVAQRIIRDFILVFFMVRLQENEHGYTASLSSSTKERMARHRRDIFAALLLRSGIPKPRLVELPEVPMRDRGQGLYCYRVTFQRKEEGFVLLMKEEFERRLRELLAATDSASPS